MFKLREVSLGVVQHGGQINASIQAGWITQNDLLAHNRR